MHRHVNAIGRPPEKPSKRDIGRRSEKNQTPDDSGRAVCVRCNTYVLGTAQMIRRRVRSRWEMFIRLTCRRPGHIQIVRNRCSSSSRCRRCRSGRAVAAPWRFRTVASRFAAGCRPSSVRRLNKII